MPKVNKTVTVTYTDKEIRDLILEDAKAKAKADGGGAAKIVIETAESDLVAGRPLLGITATVSL